ncbi:hypothetical protein Atep_18630 [Allochromatium tepidum]|uniref:Uncharacterized protein n=1 Tax=Allochromatium tepidum TaxID=553982 RepID=A0ABM7QMZ7_9GAMM|nr:hypothetical protein Atep_18630 [Allochromatium tepidum]
MPLIAALGIGLAMSLRGRNALTHGFGLVALAVMVPMIVVQLYGALVFSLGDAGLSGAAVAPVVLDEIPALDDAALPTERDHGQGRGDDFPLRHHS